MRIQYAKRFMISLIDTYTPCKSWVPRNDWTRFVSHRGVHEHDATSLDLDVLTNT